MPAERNVKIRRTSGRSSGKNPDWNASDDNTAHFRPSPDSSPADHNAPSAYTWKLPDPASSSHSLDHHVKCQSPSIHAQIQLSSCEQPSSSSSTPPSSPALANLTSVFRAGRRRGDPHRISRPRNAFIVFRSFYVKWHRNAAVTGKLTPNDPFFKIYTKSPTLPPLNQNDLSKIAGKVWNVMTELEKRPFCAQASRERAQHRRMYPEFAYTSNVGGGIRKPGKGKGKRKSTEPLPSPTLSPSFGTGSELPLLELPQRVGDVERCKQEEQSFPLFASDIPSFIDIDHIDIPAFGLYEYSDCAQDPTLPPLPTTIPADVRFDPTGMYTHPIDFSLAYPEPPSSYAPTFNDDNSKLHFDYVTYSRPEAPYLQNDGAGGYTLGNLSLAHGESTDTLFDFSAFASVDFQGS